MFDVINETSLKLISLLIRFFQFTLSIVILGGLSQVINNFANADLNVPDKYVAVTAVSGITTAWSGIALLLICCAGSIPLGIETSLDVISTVLYIITCALGSSSGLASHYMPMYNNMTPRGSTNSQGLVQMAFIMSIVLM
jgi:hypothetical protein